MSLLGKRSASTRYERLWTRPIHPMPITPTPMLCTESLLRWFTHSSKPQDSLLEFPCPLFYVPAARRTNKRNLHHGVLGNGENTLPALTCAGGGIPPRSG